MQVPEKKFGIWNFESKHGSILGFWSALLSIGKRKLPWQQMQRVQGVQRQQTALKDEPNIITFIEGRATEGSKTSTSHRIAVAEEGPHACRTLVPPDESNQATRARARTICE